MVAGCITACYLVTSTSHFAEQWLWLWIAWKVDIDDFALRCVGRDALEVHQLVFASGLISLYGDLGCPFGTGAKKLTFVCWNRSVVEVPKPLASISDRGRRSFVVTTLPEPPPSKPNCTVESPACSACPIGLSPYAELSPFIRSASGLALLFRSHAQLYAHH